MPEPSLYARIGRLSAIIFILPSAMGVGWLFGFFVVDRYLGTFPWGGIALTILGAGAGFYQIIKILMQDQRDDAGS